MTQQFDINFRYVLGEPTQALDFRTTPEDFVVEELLDFQLAGEGEHFYLQIRKVGENTHWLAERLAEYFAVKPMDVGYGGKKDRHAVTTQWFSVYLPKTPHEIDWQVFVSETELNAELVSFGSHTKKLRRGEHSANRFTITLRNVGDQVDLEQRLQQIAVQGVPNYFGEQRFGREGSNLQFAQRWFVDGEMIRNRTKKEMARSAARSYLFNLVLSERVLQNTWSSLLDGEGTEVTAGPLWGRGRPPVSGELAELERAVLSEFPQWLNALEHQGLQQERRVLCLKPTEFSWYFENGNVVVKMTLAPGEYATSVLRELAKLNNQQINTQQ